MLPRPIPALTDEQWDFLMKEMKRGPTLEMRRKLKEAIQVYETNKEQTCPCEGKGYLLR